MFIITVGLHDIQLVGNKIYLHNNQLPLFEIFSPELLQESSQKFVTINRHWGQDHLRYNRSSSTTRSFVQKYSLQL